MFMMTKMFGKDVFYNTGEDARIKAKFKMNVDNIKDQKKMFVMIKKKDKPDDLP